MKELVHAIKTAVFQEYDRAAEKFGEANNSDHESYAVILEELEEADEQRFAFKSYMEEFWKCVKGNDRKKARSYLLEMQRTASNAASEWVQVAAMCHKATQKEQANL